jgi:hypothetical protein
LCHFVRPLCMCVCVCEMGFLRQSLMNYLPGLALNLNPPDLCLLRSRIIGVSHWCPTCFSYFWDMVSHVCLGQPGLQSS